MTDFRPGDRVEWDIVDSGHVIDTKSGFVLAVSSKHVSIGDGNKWIVNKPKDLLRFYNSDTPHTLSSAGISDAHTPTQEEKEDVFRAEDVKPTVVQTSNPMGITAELITGVRGSGTQYVTGEGVTSPRASLLDEAKALVTGDRNNTYGAPTQDFDRTAGALTAMGYRGPNGRDLKAHDVAILVAMVKISRLMWTPQKRDSWADLAGYAACGYECAVTEDA